MESGNKSQKQQTVQGKQTPTASTTTASSTQASQPVSGGPDSSKLAKALSIIAEESGLAVADLTDGTVFGDVGVDSLLGLTISGRYKEELEVDLDFNALFYEYPTVGDLKLFLGQSGVSSVANSTTSSSDTESITPSTSVTGTTTPDMGELLPRSKVDFQRALEIISEESGVATADLTDETNFADSGVDSLLSLVVVSRLRDELDLDIQHESLFMECPTVADLKHLLGGVSEAQPVAPGHVIPASVPSVTERQEASIDAKETSERAESENSILASRKKAVDEYIQKYTAGFSAPVSSKSPPARSWDSGEVVLVTGASGSLGGHLVYHIAQLPHVKTVVCLNRENKADPYTRQQKAMREKGIRFPESLKPKLLVFQTDSSRPMLGLSRNEYEGLVGSVTHLIHNAWPMSAKRPLAGFESQFQTMRNLIDLACSVSSKRPDDFRFSFQMVSSIGVVGHYGLGNGEQKTVVPEKSVEIDSVLPNGYGDAKWGCERMIDATLHQCPSRFRAMAVRLGQIAGSKTSGYWNPMEHFGFLIKSSQTLNALPDVDGTVYWTPVNDIAGTLSDLVLSGQNPYPVYHIENPVGQSWRDMNTILADALKISNVIPFADWVERVRAAPQRNNPAATLLDFLDSNYLRMSCGGLVLDVKKTLEHSETLSAVGPVSEEVVRKYIHIWKEIGFLS